MPTLNQLTMARARALKWIQTNYTPPSTKISVEATSRHFIIALLNFIFYNFLYNNLWIFTTKLFANNLKKLLFRVALNGCHHLGGFRKNSFFIDCVKWWHCHFTTIEIIVLLLFWRTDKNKKYHPKVGGMVVWVGLRECCSICM